MAILIQYRNDIALLDVLCITCVGKKMNIIVDNQLLNMQLKGYI